MFQSIFYNFKIAQCSKTYTFYNTMSQDGNLNVLLNFINRFSWVSSQLIGYRIRLWITDHKFESVWDYRFEIIFWKSKFFKLKIAYFSPIWLVYFLLTMLSFIIKVFSADKLLQDKVSHLNLVLFNIQNTNKIRTQSVHIIGCILTGFPKGKIRDVHITLILIFDN